jgi:hypothetical protein
MTLDPTVKTILAALLLILSIPAAFLFWKAPHVNLPASEKELITFSSQPLTMSPPKLHAVFSGLDCPIRATQKQLPVAGTGVKNFPPGPIPGSIATPPPAANTASVPVKPVQRDSFGSHPTISMIYSEGSTQTAIINGQALQEGSVLGSSKIIKIEKNRVLLRTAGKDIWLNMD